MGHSSINLHGAGNVGNAQIGPNAVSQLVTALKMGGLERLAQPIFRAVGAEAWLTDPPSAMVDEHLVAALHQAVRAAFPMTEAKALMADAGWLTADYLLVNRIPRPARLLMQALPAPLSARILTAEIQSHAWTFAGSGRFSARVGLPTVYEIENNPLCRGERSATPVCTWHAAVFQQLFTVLVSRSAGVVETACEAQGSPCCRFVIEW
jgi:divinyl protochlorophyllide a 8-vinyl-reductase